MDAHRVHVFHGTDDHDVVIRIPQQLELIFFPAQHRLFHKHLMGGGGVQPAPERFIEL